MSGSEMQREKEKVAAKMREKQAAGKSSKQSDCVGTMLTRSQPMRRRPQRLLGRNKEMTTVL
jgi:hypothetical protein